MAGGQEKRSFNRFLNESRLSVILIKGPKNKGNIIQRKKERNPEEIDQFLDENVLFKQKVWREVDAIEASFGRGSEDPYTSCYSVDLPESVVLRELKYDAFADKLAFKSF